MSGAASYRRAKLRRRREWVVRWLDNPRPGRDPAALQAQLEAIDRELALPADELERKAAQERRKVVQEWVDAAEAQAVLPERLWRCSEALRADLAAIPTRELVTPWRGLKIHFENLGESIARRREKIARWRAELETGERVWRKPSA